MIFQPLNLAAQYDAVIANANNIDEATLVACGNGRTANSFVHIVKADSNTRIASILIPGNEIIVIKKERTQRVYSSTGAGGGGAGSSVNFTKIGFAG
jgi:hypothetical protein